MSRRYITTAIPYVNSRPHLGFAMELVEADVLARHWRHRGHEVRFLTGTDDNSLKNAIAADEAGIPTQEFVDRNAAVFQGLAELLQLSVDDFIRTSSDPRHRLGVERLWRASAESGDLYRQHYEGLYCVGCEQFYQPDELEDGLCREHQTRPQVVAEENWFFRLSRYQEKILRLLESGELRVEPPTRRNEVLSFVKQGLQDFSISRSTARARGWGIPVPDDDDQVIYVWWDALGNYITALDYGSDSPEFAQWWTNSDERSHVIGKGIVRFHAVYWPAMLMSAGVRLPDTIFVHDYLTINGGKISKSLGNAVDPEELINTYGADAVRWWLIREGGHLNDVDFTIDRLVARYTDDLANGLGNLVNRTLSMIHKYRGGRVPELKQPARAEKLITAMAAVAGEVDNSLQRFDFRAATAALWLIVDEANRYVIELAPWQLAKAEANDPAAAQALDDTLGLLYQACAQVAAELTPFLPAAASRVQRQLGDPNEPLPQPQPLFPRLELPAE